MKIRYLTFLSLFSSLLLLTLVIPIQDKNANRLNAAPAGIFSDVPNDHWARAYIEYLYNNGYIAGCSTTSLIYCPEKALTRAEMAVFMVRGIHGPAFDPPDPTVQIFDDVPIGYWGAEWIHQLYADGFTAGCSDVPLLYCPEASMTRAEASVFFLRLRNGSDYDPPTPTGIFVDAPADGSYWGTEWVEAAYNFGLIPACQEVPGEKRFCPEFPLNRALAAYMMIRTKNMMTPSTDLVADKLEVTQGVQDLYNSVRLVANKQTFVRFHVHSTSDNQLTAARLRVKRGIAVDWVSPINHQIYVRTNPDRGELNHTFLFELPSYFDTGTVSLMAEVNPGTTIRGRSPLETSYVNNIVTTDVTFEQVPRVNLRIALLGYTDGGTTYSPASSHVTKLKGWLRSAYPLNDLHVVSYHYATPFDQFPDCGEVNDYLIELRDIDVENGTVPESTRYYGMIDDRGPRGGMTGCASVPGFVASGPAGVPPTNPGHPFRWDTDGSYADWYGGHELAHSYDRRHIRGGPTDAHGCGTEPDAEMKYPYGYISPSYTGLDSDINGFDIRNHQIYRPLSKDVMTYCHPYQWLSDYTYEGLMDYFQNNLSLMALSERGASQTDRLLVVGTIDLVSQRVNLQPFVILRDADELEVRIPGPYSIVFRNNAGSQLASYPFTPDEVSDHDLLSISELVPYVAGTTQVDIVGPTGLLTSVNAGAADPTVTLLYPNGGEHLDGDLVSLLWSASDPDGDPLTFYVEYSPDNGTTWHIVAWNITGNSVDIDAFNIPGGAQGLFRVSVSDGIHTTSDQSDTTFTVPNRIPMVDITSPESGTTVVISQTVSLQASAYDVDTGTMEAGQLEWSSDIDGVLGNGAQLSLSTLSEGEHTITFRADDGVGGVSVDTVDLTVVGEVSRIPKPPDGLLVSAETEFLDLAIGINETRLFIDNQNIANTLTWNATSGQEWLELSAPSGTTPATVVATLAQGDYFANSSATVTITSPDLPDEQVVVVIELLVKEIYLPFIVR